jgi:hypothetical protein
LPTIHRFDFTSLQAASEGLRGTRKTLVFTWEVREAQLPIHQQIHSFAAHPNHTKSTDAHLPLTTTAEGMSNMAHGHETEDERGGGAEGAGVKIAFIWSAEAK